MIPRHNILIFLDSFGNICQKSSALVLFERINTSVGLFSIILTDLISNKLINCNIAIHNFIHQEQYTFPESFNNLEISLTEIGRHYIDRKIKNTIKKIEFTQDPLDSIKIGNSSFNIPSFQSTSFDDFRNDYKGRLNTDLKIVYFLITGKVIKDEKDKLFISYAWGDESHKKWVKTIADKLKGHYNLIFDQYNYFKIGEDKFSEMKKAIIQADKVLVILTPEYKLKAEKNIGGVGYEFSVITQELNRFMSNEKYIPLLRKGEREESIPFFFENKFDFDVRNGKFRFNNLLEIIKNQ